MTDRELLELAAKAAGIDLVWKGEVPFLFTGLCSDIIWHPLLDDGDALRLAVKLRFGLKDFAPQDACDELGAIPGMVEVWLEDGGDPIHVEWYEANHDRYKVTRQAIVRAAAAEGEK